MLLFLHWSEAGVHYFSKFTLKKIIIEQNMHIPQVSWQGNPNQPGTPKTPKKNSKKHPFPFEKKMPPQKANLGRFSKANFLRYPKLWPPRGWGPTTLP